MILFAKIRFFYIKTKNLMHQPKKVESLLPLSTMLCRPSAFNSGLRKPRPLSPNPPKGGMNFIYNTQSVGIATKLCMMRP